MSDQSQPESPEAVVEKIRHSDAKTVLKVASAEGHHWIRFVESATEFRAVYEGPHGPENAEATIDQANIMQRLQAVDSFEVAKLSDSPFTEPEVVR